MFDTPILFLIFNRPDTTKKVFEKIREIKPQQLFIAADGPREGSELDEVNCKEVREIIANVDWECEVEYLFREVNLGCRLAVSQAITWFFDHVEEGIILEDDTWPNVSFFSFCQELLEKYRNNSKVMMVSGDNFLTKKIRIEHSYYFSNYFHIWGWATWRRAWEKYDEDLEGLEAFENKGFYFLDLEEKRYWNERFNYVKKNRIDSWDYIWFMSIWNYGGVSVNPHRNLVKNIGFGPNATHTKTENKNYIKEAECLNEITHPTNINVNYEADSFIKNHVIFNKSNNGKIKCLIGKYLKKEHRQIIKNILLRGGMFLRK